MDEEIIIKLNIMPYKSEAQRRFMHSQHPEIAKRWDKETGGKIVKKAKLKVNNKMKGALGRTDMKTKKVEINVKKHKGDKAELASTIKHELLHVKHPKMTEKDVYKKSRKTKMSPKEQSHYLAKLRHKKINYKVGSFKRRFKMKGNLKAGDLISKMNERKRVAIMGLV